MLNFQKNLLENYMNIDIGTSLVDVSRFKSKKTLKKIFTQKEIDYCMSKIGPEEHFAARFAGKSAVIKAFSGFNKKLSFSDIEIIHLMKFLIRVA